jgi:hypothetical protein
MSAHRDETSVDAAETRLNRLLNLILETAVEALGFDAATITARHPTRGLATIGATDQRLVELDDAQYESGQGPCLTTLDPHDPVYLQDAAADDQRWQHFADTAAHLGVKSSLSLHVPTDTDQVAASLNLYAKRQLELRDQDIHHATRYAEQLAATLESVDAYKATAQLARDMAEAMRSRAVIEQAKGMLMADKRITADEAFHQLTALSQHSNLKLRDVARRLVDDRTEPPDPAGR